MIAHDQRSTGGEVLQLFIGHLLAPPLLAVLCPERDEPSVGRQEVKPIPVDAYTAISYQVPALVLPIVVPHFVSRMSINRKNMVRDGDVQNAVHHERRAFDLGRADSAKSPHV